MMLTLHKNDDFTRFVSCAGGVRLIMILAQAVKRIGKQNAPPVFPDGRQFTCNSKPSLTSENNLIRSEIFRGKISQRKDQNNKKRLEERTLPAPNS